MHGVNEHAVTDETEACARKPVQAGDKATVIGKASPHGFDIGATVTVHCVLSPIFHSCAIVHDGARADIVGQEDLCTLDTGHSR